MVYPFGVCTLFRNKRGCRRSKLIKSVNQSFVEAAKIAFKRRTVKMRRIKRVRELFRKGREIKVSKIAPRALLKRD